MKTHLTEEERAKIIEEETLRSEIRNANRENTPIDDYAEGGAQAMLATIVIAIGFFVYIFYIK